MHEEQDDVAFTAYALGELDAAERASVEARMALSPAARLEVEEIQTTVLALRAALAAAPRHELTAPQRRSIEDAAAREGKAPPRSMVRWVIGGGLASVAAVLGLIVLVVPSLWRARMSAPPPPVPMVVAPLAAPTERARAAAKPQMTRETRERLQALGYISGDASVLLNDQPSLEGLRQPSATFETNDFGEIRDNPFVLVARDARSTFSADVDTASYSIMREFLNEGRLPPRDAVRIEELVNYFPYAYEPPTDGRPFAVHMMTATCPWQPEHRLVRIAIKGREIPRAERPPSNLVFLLDVSGSMDEPNKLPLVKTAMRLLVEQLGPRDRVAIVVYAGAEGLALPSTPATEKSVILSAIESLSPGGATHGSAGIRLAYQTAAANFIEGGVNRVILATDGDFNVGVTSQGELVRLIEEKAKTGVFLTALGFGMGNLKDSTLEKLADHGNGNYAYVDGRAEAQKVLVDQIGATLITIAKDVKLQVEFNPAKVTAFRLIGYENRVLAHEDFNNDKRDAGDIGAGHTVTALYEVVPPGVEIAVPGVDPLKYQSAATPALTSSAELLTLKLRYKEPSADRSQLFEVPLEDGAVSFESAPADFRFAAAVAAFGMNLRGSPYKGDADPGKVLAWAKGSLGEDKGHLRAEFVSLIEKARPLPRE
jgi:Ca-activated chloride channel homolog